MSQDRILADLRRELAKRRTRRSPLYRWMRENYHELAPLLSDPSDRDWSVIAKVAAEHGLVDGQGKPPVKRRTRLTWYAVEKMQAMLPKPPPAPVRARATPDKGDVAEGFYVTDAPEPPKPAAEEAEDAFARTFARIGGKPIRGG